MKKARQNIVKRVAKLECAIRTSSDHAEQGRLLDERQRLQERRGIVAPAPPPPGPAPKGSNG